jgi:hypothetical protein
MPADCPFASEMGAHAEAVRSLLPVGRAPRISRGERNLIRFAHLEALANPELQHAYERREYVFERLHKSYPEEWPRGDGRSPDYDRLRPYLAELDAERTALPPGT